MNSLRDVANQYDKNANRLALRNEGKLNRVVGHTQKDGKRVPLTVAGVIQGYRTSADQVRALIRPEDDQPAEAQWSLEAASTPALASGKVTAKDKVANPKELLEKVNS